MIGPESRSFHHAHAGGEGQDWQTLATACLQQLDEVPPEANLGFLYATDLLAGDIRKLLEYFRQRLPDCHWVGTVGVGICATGQEYHEIPALSVMLGEFDPDAFQVFAGISDGLDDFRQTHAHWYQDRRAVFGLVHGDPRNNQIPALTRLLADKLNEGFLVGGLTSSHQRNPQIADGVTEGGLSGVLFSSGVDVLTRLSQGCAPLGPRHEITECRNNIIQRLDGRPALDVFKEDIGEILANDLERIGGYIFAALPVAGSDTGDYVVRNLLGVDTENKLLAIGELVEPGRALMFARRDGNTARQDLEEMLHRLRGQLSRPIRGGVYVSCLGRGQYLFGQNSEELKLIRDVLGDFPLTGFFANGEISNSRIYGYTGVLTLFL